MKKHEEKLENREDHHESFVQITHKQNMSNKRQKTMGKETEKKEKKVRLQCPPKKDQQNNSTEL